MTEGAYPTAINDYNLEINLPTEFLVKLEFSDYSVQSPNMTWEGGSNVIVIPVTGNEILTNMHQK